MLELTQNDIAEFLGVQRSTANMEAAILRSKELIEYKRGKIELLDLPGIRTEACDCVSDAMPDNGHGPNVLPKAGNDVADS